MEQRRRWGAGARRSRSAGRGARRPTPLWVGLVAMMAVSGCASHGFGLEARVAVGRDAAGATRILYALCPGEEVTTVGLFGYDGGGPEYATPIYWLAEAPAGGSVSEAVVGQAPPGFVETVPLRTDPPSDDLVRFAGLDRHRGFSARLGDLRLDQVMTGTYEEMEEGRFRSGAARTCATIRLTTAITGAGLPMVVLAGAAAVVRARRRGVVARCFGTWFWMGAVATVLASVAVSIRHYDLEPVDVAGSLVEAATYGVVAGLVGTLLSPASFGIARLRGPWAVTGSVVFAAAAAAGPLSLLRVDQADGSSWLLALAWSVAVAVAAFLTSRPARDRPGKPRRSRREVAVGALVVCVTSAALGVALLDNDPEPVTVAARRLVAPDLVRPPEGELIAEVRSGDQPGRLAEIELEPEGDYEIVVDCTGVSIQVSEGVFEAGRSKSKRRVLPCDGRPTPGTFPGSAALRIVIVDNAEPSWSVRFQRTLAGDA